MTKQGLIILFFSIAIIACKKEADETSSTDTTFNYYPVHIGHTLIYDVDSMVYDDNTGSTTIDTFYYQYKEIITSNTTDDEGKPVQLLQRFYRTNDTDSWRSANNWIVSRDNMRAEKIEENTRYVKLVFPLNDHKAWNGNMFNNKGNEEYSVDYFDVPSIVNGINYSKTLQVTQVLDMNAIEEIRRLEIYARDVGMIYFLSDSINTQPQKPPQTGKKSKGYRYRLKLKSFQ